MRKHSTRLVLLILSMVILSTALSSCAGREKTLFPVDSKYGWGYIDETGRIVIKPEFEGAAYFHEGLAAVELETGWGYIDDSGKDVMFPMFDWAGFFNEGKAPVWVDGKFGYIDMSGKFVIEPRFDYADTFRGGMALVEVDGKKGFIDANGDFVIEPRYSWAGRFYEGLALVITDDTYGYIDTTGNLAIKLPRESAPFVSEETVPESIRHSNDAGGEFRSFQKMISENRFEDGLAPVPVVRNESYGYIDHSGNMAIEPRFDYAMDFDDGLAPVELQNGKFGYIDTSGELVIETEANWARQFSEGLAAVQIGIDKWGFIDKSGEVVIEPEFEIVGDFYNGLASVGDENGYINKQGNYVWKPAWVDSRLKSYDFRKKLESVLNIAMIFVIMLTLLLAAYLLVFVYPLFRKGEYGKGIDMFMRGTKYRKIKDDPYLAKKLLLKRRKGFSIGLVFFGVVEIWGIVRLITVIATGHAPFTNTYANTTVSVLLALLPASGAFLCVVIRRLSTRSLDYLEAGPLRSPVRPGPTPPSGR